MSIRKAAGARQRENQWTLNDGVGAPSAGAHKKSRPRGAALADRAGCRAAAVRDQNEWRTPSWPPLEFVPTDSGPAWDDTENWELSLLIDDQVAYSAVRFDRL